MLCHVPQDQVSISLSAMSPGSGSINVHNSCFLNGTVQKLRTRDRRMEGDNVKNKDNPEAIS